MRTGLVSFVRTQDEGAMRRKITIGMMLPEILEWANSVGPGDVQLLWSTLGLWCLVWRLVEGLSSNSLAQSWQSMQAHVSPPPPPPLHSLLLGFEIVVRSFHANSFCAEVVR